MLARWRSINASRAPTDGKTRLIEIKESFHFESKHPAFYCQSSYFISENFRKFETKICISCKLGRIESVQHTFDEERRAKTY